MKYTVNYFIEKFEAIPEDKWCQGFFEDNGSHCAGGHCGMTNEKPNYRHNKEVVQLVSILRMTGLNRNRFDNDFFDVVAAINDGGFKEYKQPTPKQRVLAALYDIKKLQYPELSTTTVEDIISEKSFLVKDSN